MTAHQITLETMTPQHLSGAVELSRQVGWPHRREDWEFMQSLSHGIVAVDNGRVVATTLMTPYGQDGATINTVIVDASIRGRGLGRRLLEEALAQAGERNCRLVATPEGLSLYEKLGFVAVGSVIQHQGDVLPVNTPGHVVWGNDCDFERFAELDRAAYGHDRSLLMQYLQQLAKFAVIRQTGKARAFAAIREFGRGLVIGPVVASHTAEAKALIDYLLSKNQGRFVRIDTHSSANLADWLGMRGLASVDSGTAMRRSLGTVKPAGVAQYRTFALAAQALG
ncbi:N-acetyltransferase [Labrys miyagiensis]|uniref:N-acetyltransferase n=1 Tax=Labrys miyagiensis TaxID=346912 RepID=A0ABQ6CIZ2_9HYPH|nr:GNAT family N-acetyltransferase [Labrys miyagiensis]GLS20233.1 N-acetyltransferase [Labrys miyagiensis]